MANSVLRRCTFEHMLMNFLERGSSHQDSYMQCDCVWKNPGDSNQFNHIFGRRVWIAGYQL